MTIQFASDLHLEFPGNRSFLHENQIIPKADILLLAGDIICDRHKKRARKHYEFWEESFSNIISIKGNHEFYHGLVNYAYPEYASKKTENHLILNNNTILIGNIRFICSTLWSLVPDEKISVIESRLNDYHLIYSNRFQRETITTKQTNAFHKLSVQFIESELQKNFTGKTVVVTHHLPSYSCIHPKWADKPDLRSAYVSNLDGLIAKYPIDLWVFGHQHETIDIIQDETRLVSNPLGYVGDDQNMDFARDWIIKL